MKILVAQAHLTAFGSEAFPDLGFDLILPRDDFFRQLLTALVDGDTRFLIQDFHTQPLASQSKSQF
jgi:hypothetical protein